MRHYKRAIRSRHAIIPVLAIAALIFLLLPPAWTGGLISLVQVVAPLQDGAGSAVDLVSLPTPAGRATVDADEYLQLEAEKEALERRVVVLAQRIRGLEDEVDLLQATRLFGGPEASLGARGRLIPAKVLAGDMLPWRSSRLLNAGTRHGVDRGAAVVSNKMNIEWNGLDESPDGLAVLLGEALVGVVAEQVGPHVSRVALLSDVESQRKVQIGRLSDVGFSTVDSFFWLTGRGHGVMEIQQVDRRLVREGVIQKGDIVLSDAEDPVLPAAMVIGKISALRNDRDNPLLSILTVQSSVSHDTLRRVYVYDPAEPQTNVATTRG